MRIGLLPFSLLAIVPVKVQSHLRLLHRAFRKRRSRTASASGLASFWRTTKSTSCSAAAVRARPRASWRPWCWPTTDQLLSPIRTDTEGGRINFYSFVRAVLPADYAGEQWSDKRGRQMQEERHSKKQQGNDPAVRNPAGMRPSGRIAA